MQKIFASTLLTLSLFGTVTGVFAKQFPDVPNTHSNYVAINFLSDQDVLKGYPDGQFMPEKLVNRAEALKIIFAGTKAKIDPGIAKDNLFKDVKSNDWFAEFVAHAKSKGIVGGNPDGTFAPGRDVSRAEFVKMLLMTAGFKEDSWKGQEHFADVPKDAWFNPYLNYAGKAGLIAKDENNNLNPAKNLSRGEVAEILYLILVIMNGKDTQFLVDQSEAQMAQIELYVASSDVKSAKRASELAVDLTQQAYRNLPDNNVVLGAAKIAKGYDALVDAFIYALKKDYVKATELANLVITKADEAWQANNETQPIARHLKDRAREILAQIEKTKSN